MGGEAAALTTAAELRAHAEQVRPLLPCRSQQGREVSAGASGIPSSRGKYSVSYLRTMSVHVGLLAQMSIWV